MVVPVVALATSGIATAANGGFTPQHPHSPNAEHINTVYYVIFAFTAVIFVIVEAALILFVVKYRSRGRGRDVEGAQVHGNTRLELIWTVLPAVILFIIGAVVFVELPKIANVPAASAGSRLDITVEGHQYYWQFDYPNGARSIGDLHVPANTVVYLTIRSPDVAHSWWIPQLGGKTDAIPGRTNHTWFKADREGTYTGQCAEFCGVFHEAMHATVIATSDAEYQSWLAGAAKTGLGREEFQGVCATCHGMKGEGGYGPAIAGNSIIVQPTALDTVVRDGFGTMPPVGKTWTTAQMDALAAYLKQNIYTGATTSGG